MNATENKKMTYETAYARVSEIKKFYTNLVSYCLIIPFLIFINLRTSSYQWFWFPLIGWGLGIIIRGLYTFGISKSWEEKKINDLMKKER